MSLPMTKATYIAIARASSFGTAKSGNRQIAVEFEIIDGEHAGERITWMGTFSDNSTEITIKALDAMGFRGDDISDLENLDDVGAAQLLGDQVSIVCEPDTYDGDTNLKVRWVNKPGSGRFAFKEKLEGQELKQFAASMRGAFQSFRGGARKPSAPKSGNGAARHPNAPDDY